MFFCDFVFISICYTSKQMSVFYIYFVKKYTSNLCDSIPQLELKGIIFMFFNMI